MKKAIYILFAATLLTACQKADHNGDLGGYWKLLEIEDTETDVVTDKREEDRFWAIQLNLIQIANGKGRFQHVDDSLFIQMIINTENAEKYGLYNQNDARYKIEHLESKGMILKHENKILKFRKF